MNTPNGAADLLSNPPEEPPNSRPLQLPKVGWDDDDEEDPNNTNTLPFPSPDPPEAPIPPSKKSKHSSGNHVIQRVSRSELELQPIPEDFSMHGPWPDFCIYDYDVDRKKAYRYKWCGGLSFRGMGMVCCFVVLLLIVVLRHDGTTGLSGNDESELTTVQSSNSGSDNPAKLTQEQIKMYEVAAEAFHPLWYDRSRGWGGTAYLQAVDFCYNIENRVPCPYVAYCPLGVGHAPSGGVKDGGEQWAPVLDLANEWVQVGSSNPCQVYSKSHDEEPRWGLTGEDDEEITRHIMCCLNPKDGQLHENHDEDTIDSDVIHRPPSLEEDEQPKVAASTTNDNESQQTKNEEVAESEPQTQSQSKETQSAETNTEPETNEINSSQSTPNQIKDTTQDTSNNTPNQQQQPHPSKIPLTEISQTDLQQLLTFYEPLWFDRAYGFSGTTTADAQEFCHSKAGKRTICPFVAYCPQGPAGTVTEGRTSQKSIEWAPMQDWNGFHWVGIGKDNACRQARDVGEFGVSEEEVGEVGGTIMCCKDKAVPLDGV